MPLSFEGERHFGTDDDGEVIKAITQGVQDVDSELLAIMLDTIPEDERLPIFNCLLEITGVGSQDDPDIPWDPANFVGAFGPTFNRFLIVAGLDESGKAAVFQNIISGFDP